MKNILRKITALMVIILMTMSVASETLAYTVHLINVRSNGVEYYDNNANHVIQDYYVDDQTDYSYFCLTGGRRLRDDRTYGTTGNYSGKLKLNSDLSNLNDSNIKDRIKNQEAMKWLIKNIYTEGADEYSGNYMKDNLNVIINKYAPSGYKDCNVYSIDEEFIEVVEQMVIWSFVNNDYTTYDYDKIINSEDDFGKISFGGYAYQQSGQKIGYALFKALLKGATDRTYSIELNDKNSELTLNKGNNYKVTGSNGTYTLGPVQIELSQGTNLKAIQNLEDSVSVETTSIKYLDANKQVLNISNKKDLIGKGNYYVQFTTKNNKDITGQTVTYKCLADLGFSLKSLTANIFYETGRQPILQVKKRLGPNQTGDSISQKIEGMDIALTKQITKVEHYDYSKKEYVTTEYNDANSNNRLVEIKDKSSKSTTDSYMMNKKPVTVQIGDYVTYKITVYNEGNTEAVITAITDYLPENLSYVSSNSTNGRMSVNATELDGLAPKMLLSIATASTNLNYVPVGPKGSIAIEVKCQVAECPQGTELVNVAAVTGYGYLDNNGKVVEANKPKVDIDSEENDTINREEYETRINKGVFRNRINGSESRPFNKGLISQQDDDDFEIVKVGTFDLALRKFITKVGNTELTGDESREPTFTSRSAAALLSKGTAKYFHTKNPITLSSGDNVVYTIRVYNEGTLDGYAKEITDYLPAGLEFVEGSNINANWTATKNADGTTTVKTTALADKLLKAGNDGQAIAEGLASYQNRDNKLANTDYTGEVQIECKVANNVQKSKLVNVAEITSYGYYIETSGNPIFREAKYEKDSSDNTERDSQGKNAITNDSSIDDYYNNVIEPQFETDKTEYHGSQDDDDFEIVQVTPFDLALRKFITKVDDKEINGNDSREPVFTNDSVKVLKNSGTAEYYHTKQPVELKTGAKVLYTIRVYNEGLKDGYAEEITDYLPVGLKFVEGSSINSKWTATTNADGTTTVKTTALKDTKLEAGNNGVAIQESLQANDNTGKKATAKYYADVQIECEVTATTAVDLVNVAEITKYKDIDGNIANKPGVDRDSEQDNVFADKTKIATNIKNYIKRSNYNDRTKAYFPGVQDDDDFEVVKVIAKDYKFVLNKVDQDGKALNGAKFTIELDDSAVLSNAVVNGTFSKENKNVQVNKTYTYKITENESVEGYKNILGDNYIDVVMHLDENGKIAKGRYYRPGELSFVAGDEYFAKYGFQILNKNNQLVKENETDLYNKIKVTVNNDINVPELQITIPNQKEILGKYSLQLVKEDNEGNKLTGVSFKVTGTTTAELTTGNDGKATIVTDKEINKNSLTQDTYTISEIKTPDEYISLKDNITVYVNKIFENNEYKLKNASFNKDKEVTEQEVSLQDGSKVKAKLSLNGSMITVTLVNKLKPEEKKGNYNLEIEKIDSEDNTKKLEGVTFNVNGKTTAATGKDGKVKVVENKSITKSTLAQDTYTISEIKTLNGYVSFGKDTSINVYVKKTDNSNGYAVSKVSLNKDTDVTEQEATLEDGTKVTVKVALNGNTITVTIPNKIEEKNGQYSLEIEKVDTDNNKLEGVTFKVNDKLTNPTGKDGKVMVIANKAITKTTLNTDEYTISEINTSDEYISLKDSITVYVTKTKKDKEYVASKASFSKDRDVTEQEAILQDGTKVKVTVAIHGDTVTVTIPNKPVAPGKYNLEIVKVDMDNNKLEGVTFKVNGKETVATGKDGKVTVIENKLISQANVDTIDTFEIGEVKVSDKYVSLADAITVYVSKVKEGTDYKLNKASFSKDKEVTEQEVTLKDGSKANVKVAVNENTVTVTIPNKPKVFDLALRKWVTKAIVIEDGKETVTQTGHKAEDDPEDIVKVDLHRKKLSNVVVKFEYQIRVTNEGSIEGYVREISDYIPEGLKFVQEDNPTWKEVNGKVTTDELKDTLLKPGESAEVTIKLTWINGEDNMGLKVNTAEISEDYNEWGVPDIDSTPNNKVPGEDDIDDAPVMLTITTGRAVTYIAITLSALALLGVGTTLIKKYVL